jgi:heterodisulfide reductase subunit A-like polyferredoxin
LQLLRKISAAGAAIATSQARGLVSANFTSSAMPRVLSNENTHMTEALRVAIVGGGIGGLTAAAALRARGTKATVFE